MPSMLRSIHALALRAFKLLSLFVRVRYLGMARYARYRTRGLPLDEKMVFFEVYRAVKITDTPYAMFKTMIEDPHYKDYTFVWAIDDRDNEYRKMYSGRSNVRFCRIHSRAYAKTLYTAKYLVNNKTWPFYFSKRPGQVNVFTWHATAFKALGKEQGGTVGQFKNTTRALLHTDYLVMPNRFTSEVILRSNDVQGIFPGIVLEEGYPRIDLTLGTAREQMTALLQRVSGVDPAKKVVLYAPTWRGETGGYRDTMDVIVAHVRELRSLLPDEFELVLKVHDLTYTHLRGRNDLHGIRYVPDWVDTNELLAGVDILITDYSSIFFDFLVLDRPVIFFVYDLEDYAVDRGLYFDMNDMPGPLCHTAAEVAEAVVNADDTGVRYFARRAAMREEYCGAEDGRSSQRVCDAIFKGVSARSAYRSFDEEKTRILAVGCSFDHTSQAFELIGLSRHLDYETCDLSVLFTDDVTPERERLLRMLDQRTRVLYSLGYPTFTVGEFWLYETHKAKPAAQRCAPDEAAKRQPYIEQEIHRLTGQTHFDIGVCFTDEANEGAYLLAFGQFDRRVMWLVDAELDTSKSFPPEVVMERFSRVFFVPEVAGSRSIRRIRALAKKAPVPADAATVLHPIERFVGFEESVAAMFEEQMRQARRRLTVAMHRLGDAGCVPDEFGVRRKMVSVADEGLSNVADAVRAWVIEREEGRGFDHLRHNREIIEVFLAEAEDPGGLGESAVDI